jgi:hypothetical protein
MHAGVSLTCISILVHSYIAAVDCCCGTLFLNKLEPAVQSIISIATGIYKFISFLILYAFVWLSWSSGSGQLPIFFSESIYECGGPFRWAWGAGLGGAAVETQKFVPNCYMHLGLVKYLVWICLDTEWLLKGLSVNEIWKAWNLGSRTHNQHV